MNIDFIFFSEFRLRWYFDISSSTEGLSPAMARDSFFMELLHFRQLETLLLVFDEREDEEFLRLPEVLDLLPNLKTLGVG